MLPETSKLLHAIRTDPDVRAALGDTFDFYLVDDERHFDWFTTDGPAERCVIARKGSGCVFLLFGSDDRLGFVSSEGQAGIIAANLVEGITLVLAHPYWEDLLAANLDAMRLRVNDAEEAALSDIEHLEEHRALVRARLGLNEGNDVVGALHRALTSLGTDFVVRPRDEPDFVFQRMIP